MNPIYGVVAWSIIGAVAGWLAGKLMRTDRAIGASANVGVGVFGALAGGTIARVMFTEVTRGAFLASLFAALLGACVLVGIAKVVSRGNAAQKKV